LFIALVYLYARYIGTTGITLREYNISSEEIPESFDGFSIVQFSDLELGSTFNIENLKDLVEKINKLKPNIVVFTGDLLSEDYNLSNKKKEEIINNLSNIDSLIGNYSVRGDDDVKGNFYEEIMTSSNFTDLTNSYELIYYKGLTPIVLYGLDSQKGNIQEYNISLMLSGHSHNSEINIPGIKSLYQIEGAKKYYDEKYKVGGTELYISSGLGTTKFKMRLFARPSISIFRLYHD